MSTKISRSKAIGLVWQESMLRGWDAEELHDNLKSLQPAIRWSSLSRSSGYDLSVILRRLFGIKVYVEDPANIRYILHLCKNDKARKKLKGLLEHWKKESIYQLKNRQLGFVIKFITTGTS
jgi:DNA-binding transcriptional regulator YbjK